MKKLLLATALLALTACGGGANRRITDLPLVWTGVSRAPLPSAEVKSALGTVAIEPGEYRDARTTPPNVVGTYVRDGYKVTTSGDVRAFWATRQRALLEEAGMRFQTPGGARIDATLFQLDVAEGTTYDATARVAFTVSTRTAAPWTKTYDGHGRRKTRAHKPQAYDEALSIAITDATDQLLHDPAFAAAIEGKASPSAAPATKL